MQDITIQFFVVITLILFQYFTNRYLYVSDIVKLGIHFIVFLESITLILFYQQFNIFLSFILLLFAIFFSQNILRNTTKNNVVFTNNKNVLENVLILWSPNFKFLGIFFFVSYLFLEYNFFDGQLNRNGIWIILLSLIYFVYEYIPTELNKGINYIFIFSHILFILIILPSILINFNTNYIIEPTAFWYSSSDLVYYILAIPLESMLNLTGYWAEAEGTTISFEDLVAHKVQRVVIGESCSGLHSVSIFISAFISYILIFYDKISIKSILLMIMGVIMSYLANLVRMYIIVLSGHYYGLDILLWVHSNIGSLIFILWTYIFFYIFSKYDSSFV